MVEGTVFNIQKYSIHDGPGIRTTVFFKGCPLNCWWCHNPESQNSEIEYTYDADKCIGCGDCECRSCEGCAEACAAEAIEQIGNLFSVEEIVRQVVQDRVFYEQSAGGVTLSGGEPMQQIEFLKELLPVLKDNKIHTAIDTCGLTSWSNFDDILDYVDLFLYDLKHMDDDKHKKYTGVSNEVILSNLIRLKEKGKNVWIRIPIIPTINDDDIALDRFIDFINEHNFKDVFLLPYHNIMTGKYDKLDMDYGLAEVSTPTRERMEYIANRFKGHGLNVKIGG